MLCRRGQDLVELKDTTTLEELTVLDTVSIQAVKEVLPLPAELQERHPILDTHAQSLNRWLHEQTILAMSLWATVDTVLQDEQDQVVP